MGDLSKIRLQKISSGIYDAGEIAQAQDVLKSRDPAERSTTMSALEEPSKKFIKVHAVAAMFDVSESTIWRWVKNDPKFPKPHKLGDNCSRWSVEELEEFAQALRKGRSSEGTGEQFV